MRVAFRVTTLLLFVLLGIVVSSPTAAVTTSAAPLAQSNKFLSCNASKGTGGLAKGSHDTTIAGRPAHVIVGANYNPEKPTYLAFYLHNDAGDYMVNADPENPIRQLIDELGAIYVAPQITPLGTPPTYPWDGGGPTSPSIISNGLLLRNVFAEIFEQYNVCADLLLGASQQGGSVFYDSYFFPTYGGRYPTYMHMSCGASGYNTEALNYRNAQLLSTNKWVLDRIGLRYAIGNGDPDYSKYLMSSRTYTRLGFPVTSDVLTGATTCAELDVAQKTADYWRSATSQINLTTFSIYLPLTLKVE